MGGLIVRAYLSGKQNTSGSVRASARYARAEVGLDANFRSSAEHHIGLRPDQQTGASTGESIPLRSCDLESESTICEVSILGIIGNAGGFFRSMAKATEL
jgi:hypothetical protein